MNRVSTFAKILIKFCQWMCVCFLFLLSFDIFSSICYFILFFFCCCCRSIETSNNGIENNYYTMGAANLFYSYRPFSIEVFVQFFFFFFCFVSPLEWLPNIFSLCYRNSEFLILIAWKCKLSFACKQCFHWFSQLFVSFSCVVC